MDLNNTYVSMVKCTKNFVIAIQSFRDNKYRKQTEVSKHVWQFKDNEINYDIEWDITYALQYLYEKFSHLQPLFARKACCGV